MKKLKKIAFVFLALLIWTLFVGYGLFNGFLLTTINKEDSLEGFVAATEVKIKEEFVGNLAMVLVENGQVAKTFFYSKDDSIDEKSLFPVASISKWVTSFGVMRLVEQGKLDLDKPVDDYLTRWHLPESDFDNKKVTVRRLLSHSSGLIDDLGYAGFAEDEKVQTIEESLTKAADAPYSEGVAKVGYEPGSQYMYSGAAYTLLQLLIEEVTNQSFQAYMTTEVLEPLGMESSTFVLAEKPNHQLVDIYKDDGTTRRPKKFTALAAASLFTNIADLSKFLMANVSDNKVLKLATIEAMSEPQTFRGDVGIYGLGPHLYSQNQRNSTIIGHDGSGENALNTAARIDLQSKNGIIILETGNHSLASSMADEWLFWQAGIADYVVIMRNKPYLMILLLVGYGAIILLSIFIIRFKTPFE